MTETQKKLVTLQAEHKKLQTKLAESEQTVEDLEAKFRRDFDDQVVTGHLCFLRDQRRRNLLGLAAQAIEASDAHVAHFDACAECQKSVLWCPEWYRICEAAAERRKMVLSALKEEDLEEATARTMVDTEATELLRLYRSTSSKKK
jgi:hypothetical protein